MAVGTITFEAGGTSITINNPQWGYKTTVRLAMDRGGRVTDGKLLWTDDGISYDYRMFEGVFVLPFDQQYNLQDFFSNDSKGRGNQVRMIVPSGITPYGPDLGDGRRKFEVKLVDATWGGSGPRPWKQFRSRLRFEMVDSQDYTLPSLVEQGSDALRIGGIVGFRFPPGFYAPTTRYSVTAKEKWGGDVEHIDGSTGRDWAESQFTIVANRSMSARLVYYLTHTARGNDFALRANAGSYVFGRDHTDTGLNVGGGNYTVRLIEPEIVIVHKRLHQFLISMHVLYRSYSAL